MKPIHLSSWLLGIGILPLSFSFSLPWITIQSSVLLVADTPSSPSIILNSLFFLVMQSTIMSYRCCNHWKFVFLHRDIKKEAYLLGIFTYSCVTRARAIMPYRNRSLVWEATLLLKFQQLKYEDQGGEFWHQLLQEIYRDFI